MASGETPKEVLARLSDRVWQLPPLILHPFSDPAGADKLMASSRASLVLYGLLPGDNVEADELARKVLEGRMCEIRMLFFVGRDLMRWTEQCSDFVSRLDEIRGIGIREESFADMLVKSPPVAVQEKLKTWGVSDFRSIFSRAIGLNAIFRSAPQLETLSDHFVRNYYRYADHMFACSQQMTPFTEVHSRNFHFEIFASGEYSRMLERQWEADR